jgi:hypothetical protein
MPHGPQVPLTPQTNERNFPVWNEDAPPGFSGHPYPKMLTRICTRADREEWLQIHRKRDQNTKEDYWEESPPVVGSPIPVLVTQDLVNEGLFRVAGQPVIMTDKEHEALVCAKLGMPRAPEVKPKTVAIPIAGRSVDDLLAENQALRQALSGKTKPVVQRKRRTVPKVRAGHVIEEGAGE